MVLTPLPRRAGPRPAVSAGIPHRQLDQQPDPAGLRLALVAAVLDNLPAGVHEEPSGISVPGARALVLDAPAGPSAAFLTGREFAHVHPVPDSSLHLTLPEATAQEAVAAGWAEPHPLVATGRVPPTTVLVYAPRTHEEIDVVRHLVDQSYEFARSTAPVHTHGSPAAPSSPS